MRTTFWGRSWSSECLQYFALDCVVYQTNAMAKTVLVSLGEKKKPIKIPRETEDEVFFIKSKVPVLFRLGEAVSTYYSSLLVLTDDPCACQQCEITIQRYCEDWGEFIDVEEGDVIEDKEKLKVVVERSAVRRGESADQELEV